MSLRSFRVSLLLSCLIVPQLAEGASGQTLLHYIQKTAGGGGGHNGFFAHNVGDIDGDGVDDLALRHPNEITPDGSTSQIRISSGADNSVIVEFISGTDPDDPRFGPVDGVGDIDGDGVGDLVISFRGWLGPDPVTYPTVRILSGADPSVVLGSVDVAQGPWQAIHQVLGVGDVDGDDVGDYAFSYFGCGPGPGTNHHGAVEVRSGADDSLIHSFCGDEPGDDFGALLRRAGDVDGDGVTDILVAAPQANNYGAGDTGYARVHSGADGTVLVDVEDPGGSVNPAFASAVDSVGDLNDDGHDDILVGARQAIFGSDWLGAARVFSGLDGSLLLEIRGSQHYKQFGERVLGPGDLNGDGVPDVVVGSDDVGGGLNGVEAFSGADGTLLYALANDTSNYNVEVVALGDTNGDAVPDLVMASGFPAPGGNGSVGWARFHSGRRLLFPDLGHGLAGTTGVPVLTGEGSLRLDMPLELTLAGAAPSSFAWLVIGLTAIDAGFKGGVLVPAPQLVLGGIVTDAQGGFQIVTSLEVPDGVELYWQVWIADAGGPFGFAASNALLASQAAVHAP